MKIRHILLVLLLIGQISSCSKAAKETSRTPGNLDPNYHGRVILGPLSDSTVELYDMDQLASPLYSTSTTTSGNLEEIGYFDIPKNLIKVDGLYIIKVYQGEDFDTDLDGIIDATGTAVDGALHAVMAQQHFVNNFTVSTLTEIIYLRLRYMLGAKYSKALILRESERRSGILLSKDIDTDGTKTYLDILAWNPYDFRDVLHMGRDKLLSFNSYVHSNNTQLFTRESHKFSSHVFGYISISPPKISQGIPQSKMGTYTDYVYTVNGNGLVVINKSNISQPTLEPLTGTVDTALIDSFQIQDDMMYAATAVSGLRIYQLSNLGRPNIQGKVDLPTPGNPAYQVFRYQDTIYVIEQLALLDVPAVFAMHVYDITTVTQPSFVKSISLPELSGLGDINGSFLYLPSGNGVQIVSLENPQSPVLINDIDSSGIVNQFVAVDNVGYAAHQSRGLLIYDLLTPTTPQEISSSSSAFQGLYLQSESNKVYIKSASKLYTFDVSSSSGPVLEGSLFDFEGGQFVIQDKIAYPYASWIFPFDVNVPQDTYILKFVEFEGIAADIHVEQNQMFLQEKFTVDPYFITSDDRENRIHTFDIQDPLNPIKKGLAKITYFASEFDSDVGSLTFKDGFLYALSDPKRIDIFNVTDITLPSFVQSVAMQKVSVTGLTYQNYLLAVTSDLTDSDYLEIFEYGVGSLSSISTIQLNSPSENPSIVFKDMLLTRVNAGGLNIYDLTNIATLNQTNFSSQLLNTLDMGQIRDIAAYQDDLFVITKCATCGAFYQYLKFSLDQQLNAVVQVDTQSFLNQFNIKLN